MGKLSPPLKIQAWLNSALSFHRVLKNPSKLVSLSAAKYRMYM